jgi:hypothetical protein
MAQRKMAVNLTAVKQKFVSNVRLLANRSREEHFQSLQQTIRDSIQNTLQPALKEDILDELLSRGVSAEALTTSFVKQKPMSTRKIRYGPADAFRALENKIASPFIKGSALVSRLRAADDESNDPAADASTDGVEQLGFMLRAPIAVLAAIPFVLGSPIWPLITRVRILFQHK